MTEFMKMVLLVAELGKALHNVPPNGTGVAEMPKKAKEAYAQIKEIYKETSQSNKTTFHFLLEGSLSISHAQHPDLIARLMQVEMMGG